METKANEKGRTAQFVKGATGTKGFIQDSLPQLAVAGRSNVGKSSLLNTLLKRKNLARTGKTPGKTQEVNYFLIDESFYLVDLPGVGYAKVSKEQRGQITRMIYQYLEQTATLAGVIYLVDLKTCGTVLDQEVVQKILAKEIPVLIVGTKRDKLSRKDLDKSLSLIQKRFNLESKPIVTSSLKKLGTEELWKSIDEAIDLMKADLLENQTK